jgi:hypothetical protein
MERREFLQQISIESWSEGQVLVGMVLPPVRRSEEAALPEVSNG